MHRFPALPHILFRGFQHLRHTTLAAGTAVKNQCLHIPNFSAKVGIFHMMTLLLVQLQFYNESHYQPNTTKAQHTGSINQRGGFSVCPAFLSNKIIGNRITTDKIAQHQTYSHAGQQASHFQSRKRKATSTQFRRIHPRKQSQSA